MMKILFRGTFAVALALTLTATGLWAAGAEEEGSTAAADREMVRDPATGQMILKPQYGGSIAEALPRDEGHLDLWWGAQNGRTAVNLLLQELGIVDWSIDRDEWSLQSNYTPLSVVRGQLAESYEISPDGLTYTFHIRPGVYWHDKAPMNGRELVAEDIVFNFHRMTGLGSGFTEKSAYAVQITSIPFASITAPDKYTVVFKLTQPDFNALEFIYFGSTYAWIYPPEVIKQYGHMQDWKTAVGTGPYMLTDRVEDSSLTYTKNPNYWGYDEKFPENRLPYLDEVKFLVIPDYSTRLSALRTGKIGRLWQVSFDQAQPILNTNPELLWSTAPTGSAYNFAMDVRKPPFEDIRVRHAMQLALDVETINNTMFGGLGDPGPYGIAGPATIGFYTPFEEWPDEIKQYYRYDPEAAQKLLDEAGYARGADGVRFKTKLMIDPTYTWASNMDHTQLAAAYWAEIGVDVELDIVEGAVWAARVNAHSYEGMTRASTPVNWNPLDKIKENTSDQPWNMPGNQDPVFDAMVEAAGNAGSREEMMELVKKADNYHIEQQWVIWGSAIRSNFVFWQPWMVGYNGETNLGGARNWLYPSRVWLDADLKEAMGH